MSVVDVYKSPISSLAYNEPSQSPSLSKPTMVDQNQDHLPVENGDVDKTVGTANMSVAPPRKRVKRSSSSSSLHDHVDIKVADGVTASAYPLSTLTTPSLCLAQALTTPTLCLAQALPLSGRIIGTVWQPVQSQYTTAPVTSSNGICLFVLSIYVI